MSATVAPEVLLTVVEESSLIVLEPFGPWTVIESGLTAVTVWPPKPPAPPKRPRP